MLTHSNAVEGAATRKQEVILDQVLRGAEAASWQAGYMLYVVHDSDRLMEGMRSAPFEDIRGTILAGGVVTPSVVHAARAADAPIVLIGGHLPGQGLPSVASNSMEGVRSAVAHLIKLGHRRIGLANGPSETYTSIEKKAGYLTALAEAGIPSDLSLIRWHNGYAGFYVDESIALTNELLDLPDRPSAIVFATDGMAVAGMAACRARGLAIPADISIVGFQDDEDAQLALPRLTTVRVDRLAWGTAAVRRLLSTFDSTPSGEDRLLLPTQLVIRESTGPAPFDGNNMK